jgi:glycerol-3-phosphate dehydrogenase (NAD(P)+)
MAAMDKARTNGRYLPDIALPDTLMPTADIAKALDGVQDILIVVPSHAFVDCLDRIEPYVKSDTRIAWASKGLDPKTGILLHERVKERFGDRPVAVLSGPTFAKELAANLPTAITLAVEDDAFYQRLTEIFHNDAFRIYRSEDIIGTQLGGAVKNVIAVGAGMSDGLGFGANARTALITRGLAEIMRLGEALHANPQTLNGMAGLGDLVLTCTDNQSRNRRFGLAIGRGESVEQALAGIGQVVEGYRNTKEVLMLAKRLGVSMPITETLYKVLYEELAPKKAAHLLLTRELKAEF